MIVRLQLFALARELVGSDAIEVEIPTGGTVGQLRQTLADMSAELAELVRHSAVAVNAEYATNETIIDPNAEVVLIPPVSGG